jgi:hypothetical protein
VGEISSQVTPRRHWELELGIKVVISGAKIQETPAVFDRDISHGSPWLTSTRCVAVDGINSWEPKNGNDKARAETGIAAYVHSPFKDRLCRQHRTVVATAERAPPGNRPTRLPPQYGLKTMTDEDDDDDDDDNAERCWGRSSVLSILRDSAIEADASADTTTPGIGNIFKLKTRRVRWESQVPVDDDPFPTLESFHRCPTVSFPDRQHSIIPLKRRATGGFRNSLSGLRWTEKALGSSSEAPRS